MEAVSNKSTVLQCLQTHGRLTVRELSEKCNLTEQQVLNVLYVLRAKKVIHHFQRDGTWGLPESEPRNRWSFK